MEMCRHIKTIWSEKIKPVIFHNFTHVALKGLTIYCYPTHKYFLIETFMLEKTPFFFDKYLSPSLNSFIDKNNPLSHSISVAELFSRLMITYLLKNRYLVLASLNDNQLPIFPSITYGLHLYYTVSAYVKLVFIVIIAGSYVILPFLKKLFIKHCGTFFTEYNLTYDNFLKTVGAVSLAINERRVIDVEFNGARIFSNIFNAPLVLSAEKLNEICPLRCPGLNNNNKNDDDPEYSIPSECSICMEDFNNKGLFRTLPCKHSFHAVCVDNWLLGKSSTCPICSEKLLKKEE